MKPVRVAMVMMLWTLALPAQADVLLLGNQHIGNNENAAFTPTDPVTRAQMQASPTRFHLSQSVTISAVRFDNSVSLENYIVAIEFDQDGVARSGALSGEVFTLTTPYTLSAGEHSIFPDPGCFDAGLNPAPCPAVSENDIGFSALTLISAQTTTSRALTQRRHLGDDNDALNDDYGGDYYPDVLDAPPADLRTDITFNLDFARVLNLVHIYRLRGVNTPAGGHAQLLVDGQLVGELTNSGDPLVLSTSLFLSAGAHTLSVIAGTISPGPPVNRDSISWDDIVLLFGSPSAGTPGRFNAVDEGLDAVSGVVRTKISGTGFALDIVALDLTGTAPLPAYTGVVDLELLDARDDSGTLDFYGCRSSWTAVQALGSLVIGASDAGRRAISISYAQALRIARVRVVDSATGISGCSADPFAIRPDRLDLRVSDGTAVSAGTTRLLNDTGTGGSVTHRAGQVFTLRVRPFAVGSASAILSGYDTSPSVLPLSPVAGATLGVLSVASWLPPNPTTGTVRSNTARYSEAGTLQMRVEDQSFAAVDIGDGSTLAQRAITPFTTGVGRFTPDHFSFVSSAARFAPACGSFSYEGQPILFSTAPQFVVEARNAADQPTVNYAGSLFKLAAPTPAAWTYSAANGDVPGVLLTPTPGAVIVSGTPGVVAGQVALSFSATSLSVDRFGPRAPLDLEVELLGAGLADSDGVAYSGVEPLSIGQAADGFGIPFDGVGTPSQIRFGRLFVQNAYGSELTPLNVPFGTEYFAGTGVGFARNLADGCTSVAAPALSGPFAAATSVQAVTTPLLAGLGSIRLAAPTGAATGTVDLLTTPDDWLRVDSDNNTVYDNAVDSLATFGVFREGERRIYLRETYR